MNKRRERPPLSDRGRRRALRTWGFYLLALTAWVTVVLAAVFLGYLVCSAFTWYAWDPLYQFLNWVRDYIVFVCMLVILLGWVAISYSFIALEERQLAGDNADRLTGGALHILSDELTVRSGIGEHLRFVVDRQRFMQG